MKVLIHFLLVASCLTISIGDALLLNRTDFINDPHVSKLRPVLETFHPAVRIWLNGVIGDRLAVANGFTKIIAGGGKPFPLLRMFFRSRLVRWIAFLAFLKVAFSLFVICCQCNLNRPTGSDGDEEAIGTGDLCTCFVAFFEVMLEKGGGEANPYIS
ncbi:hypothetical protein OUZ56_014670 [Daphnia magna]|uniref:Uncharacterized protein n=1 Tax=Daphnia magna TaxID=35525 RepID=A0ABR0AKH2_9CRUS|nr:hypothetical protein OUZ56_014670 [Daphnia magna]